MATAVHALGGTIGSRSGRARAPPSLLNLPLTLAIVRSLIVEVDQERYAVPIAQVAATVRAEPETMHEINQSGVALWRGELIQVSDGGALLGTGADPSGARRFYVVISSGQPAAGNSGGSAHRTSGRRGEEPRPALGRPDVVSGTTILGDGQVACILDPVRILEQRSAGADERRTACFASPTSSAPAAAAEAPPRCPSCTWSPSPSIGKSSASRSQQVREVIRVGEITRVPQAPAHVRGVTNLRGRILAGGRDPHPAGAHAGGDHAQDRGSW